MKNKQTTKTINIKAIQNKRVLKCSEYKYTDKIIKLITFQLILKAKEFKSLN